MTTADDVDVDVYLVDANQMLVESAETDSATETIVAGLELPGTYYVVILPYDTAAVGGGTTAAPYSVTYTSVAAECTADADCTVDANRTVCDTTVLACVGCLDNSNCTAAGTPACVNTVCGSYDECTGDDAFEPTSDGPAGASELAVGASANAKICGDHPEPISPNESDWYTFTLAAPTNVRATLSWPNAADDLDLTIYDDQLNFVDSSVLDNPEIVELPTLAAGQYYIRVISYEKPTDPLVAADYTIALETY